METRRQISGPIRFAAILTLLFACVLQPSAQEAKETSPPSLPFFEWNRCPFEGCVYRKWKAEAPVQLYTTWKKSRHRIGTLPKGETVLAQTGVVITFKPGLVRMERDAPPQSAGEPILKAGDTILTYSYQGEGVVTAWAKGHFFESLDITFAVWPDGSGCSNECLAKYVDLGQTEWWAKVRLRSGQIAWVLMNRGLVSAG